MIVVLGHVCLDLFPATPSLRDLKPGRLIHAGAMTAVPGGAVANVGRALEALGAERRLAGGVGDDDLGRWLSRLLPGLRPLDFPGDTSYSVVLSAQDWDRTFLHHPGLNDAFEADRVPRDVLDGAEWLHFGYPPLMRGVYLDGGRALADLFRDAQDCGIGVSLDLAMPDPQSEAGEVDWLAWHRTVLPYVDVFTPSEDELAACLGDVDPLDLGARAIFLKRGAEGGEYRGADGQFRLSPPPTRVVGTTGAGDASIAGFLWARTQGYGAAECLAAAVLTGAKSCEAADPVSALAGFRPL